MPMVETSVAVATPSTTAARIRNGSTSAGSAMTKRAADLARGRALDVGRDLRRGSASARRTQSSDRQHQRRQQAAGEQRRDRDAGDRADGDQHEARRNGFGLRAGRGQQRDQLARLGAARASSRGTAPARPPPCRRPSSRKCRTPDTSRRAARSDRPPRTWPSRLARNATMARAMPVISISRPRNTNSGTASRMRWLMPSSMRPTRTSQRRRASSAPDSRSVARPNAKAIGTPANTVAATTPTKKISRLRLPSLWNSGRGEPEQRDEQRRPRRARRTSASGDAGLGEPQHREHRHQHDADRQRRGAPGVVNLQRRRRDRTTSSQRVIAGRPGRSAAGRRAPAPVAKASNDRARRRAAACRRRPSSACARRGATRSPRRASPATGTGSRPVRPTRSAARGRRSGRPRRRTGSTISATTSSRRRNLDAAPSQASSRRHAAVRPRLARRQRRRLNSAMASRELADRLLQHAPRPRRRICPSTRRRSRRSAACRGTAPDRAD